MTSISRHSREEYHRPRGYTLVTVAEEYEAKKEQLAALRPGEMIIRMIDGNLTGGAGI